MVDVFKVSALSDVAPERSVCVLKVMFVRGG